MHYYLALANVGGGMIMVMHKNGGYEALEEGVGCCGRGEFCNGFPRSGIELPP